MCCSKEGGGAVPVATVIVTDSQDELRGKVLSRTAEGPALASGGNAFGKSEVDELRIAVLIDHDVLGFQVTEEISEAVEVPESQSQVADLGPASKNDEGEAG